MIERKELYTVMEAVIPHELWNSFNWTDSKMSEVFHTHSKETHPLEIEVVDVQWRKDTFTILYNQYTRKRSREINNVTD